MRILSLQLPMYLSDLEKNRDTFLGELSQLIDEKDSIILLPEMWGCGFDYKNLNSFAEKTDELIQEIQSVINENTLVISSLPEKNQNKVYNTVYAVSKSGVIGKYRKNFLFSPMREDEYIDKGNNITVVDFKGVKVGLQLCYEIRFPELFRLSAFAGADVIVVPAVWPEMKKEHWLTLLRARAIENQCYIAGCNTSVMSGKKPMNCGFSATIDPWGTFCFEPSADEGVYEAEIDPEMVKDIREKIPSFDDARNTFEINGIDN